MSTYYSDVESYLKMGGQLVMWWYMPLVVGIVLEDLPNPGLAIAHPAHPSPTSLYVDYVSLGKFPKQSPVVLHHVSYIRFMSFGQGIECQNWC